MEELKTKQTNANVKKFLESVENEQRRADGLKLLDIFTEVTGLQPKIWGTSIVGFGSYHYKSERSRQEGDWPLIGFSPRKQSLTLYIFFSSGKSSEELKKLGKYKTSVGCLYINKLSDVDIRVLKKIIKRSFLEMKKLHGVK